MEKLKEIYGKLLEYYKSLNEEENEDVLLNILRDIMRKSYLVYGNFCGVNYNLEMNASMYFDTQYMFNLGATNIYFIEHNFDYGILHIPSRKYVKVVYKSALESALIWVLTVLEYMGNKGEEIEISEEEEIAVLEKVRQYLEETNDSVSNLFNIII